MLPRSLSGGTPGLKMQLPQEARRGCGKSGAVGAGGTSPPGAGEAPVLDLDLPETREFNPFSNFNSVPRAPRACQIPRNSPVSAAHAFNFYLSNGTARGQGLPLWSLPAQARGVSAGRDHGARRPDARKRDPGRGAGGLPPRSTEAPKPGGPCAGQGADAEGASGCCRRCARGAR